MQIIKGDNINLKFATLDDRKLIYKMLTSPETSHFMFNDDFPAPTWDEFCQEDKSYYLGEASRSGSYLLIELDGSIIGSISYACEYVKTPYCELDIWMGELANTGKGIGREAINLIISYVYRKYAINSYLIRPWIKNKNAIKAYKKCGFLEDENLKLEKYYSDEAMDEYGDGDYGLEETVTLIKTINSML